MLLRFGQVLHLKKYIHGGLSFASLAFFKDLNALIHVADIGSVIFGFRFSSRLTGENGVNSEVQEEIILAITEATMEDDDMEDDEMEEDKMEEDEMC
ncbi:uncharacterized protein MELLADRAFT_71605 [Melampsora larici-populina 98AG31]